MAPFAPELAYGYRRQDVVIVGDVAQSANSALLGQLERLLRDAALAYQRRLYQDAVDDYQAARLLIWRQLFPSIDFDDAVAHKEDLWRPLVSYAAEWLNILPIEQATNGVRPREDVPSGIGDLLGLRSELFDDVGVRAAADLELARTLTANGNPGAAEFFQERAKKKAPELVQLLSQEVPPPALERAGEAGVAEAGNGERQGPAGLRAAPLPREPITPQIVDVPPLPPGPLIGIDPPIIRVPPQVTVDRRAYRLKVGDELTTISWNAGEAPSVDEIIEAVYAKRRTLGELPDALMAAKHPADVAVATAHIWYYETPLGLAECYHALGEWEAAETWYRNVAGYAYLNVVNEVPYVWTRLARLYVEWGDSLFRNDQPADAAAKYLNVITEDGQPPAAGTLYTAAALQPTADVARAIIANLADETALTASPNVATIVLDARTQLAKIAGGLDFWGHWADNVPIWTFDYLQSVAVNFCQLAVSAERDAMNFWERADAGTLTRTQLVQNVSQAHAEARAAYQQATAADAEVGAYEAGVQVAQTRAADARANVTEYTAKSWEWTLHQALAAQLSGGDNEDPVALNRLADQLIHGIDMRNVKDRLGTLIAAEQLASSRLQSAYEIDSMNRQAIELDAVQSQAGAELAAARARAVALHAAATAASLRVANAQQLVAVFDASRFTPDVWNRLGQRMSSLSQRYLAMALDIAKRMQRAYNFENDDSLRIIRPDYDSDAVNGFLAAEALLADIQTFTYDVVTSTAPKEQPVKQTISLATSYPFLFEKTFRAKGRMEFQTRIEDFDCVYPGTYAGRIEHVEVAIDGIVPPRGVSGTLSNTGISHYRVPASAWSGGSGLKHRVQRPETAVLSDYDVRSDAIVVDQDRRKLGVFEGAGVASDWTLDLPPAINEIDYGAITDVRLTFTYRARFDPELETRVLADLATRPASNERSRSIPLLWLFPDAFFAFYTSGVLSFTLRPGFFPVNQRDPQLQGLSLVVVTSPPAARAGITLALSTPGKAAVSVETEADGTVPSSAAALTTAVGGSALGDYRIELRGADNPWWVTDGALALDPIVNIALVISYSFTPRA